MSYRYRILHIADPHFSNCHYTGDPEEVGWRHAQEVKEALEKHTSLSPFDAMVLSGDFTFACQPEGFQAAKVFIDTFMSFQTNYEPLVRRNGLMIIPGNHDIDLSPPVVIKNLSLPLSKEESEAPFRKFLTQIGKYVNPSNHWLSMWKRFKGNGHPEDRGLVIMALNSCRAERRDTQGWGYIGMDQIHAAASELLDAPRDKSGAAPGDIVLAVIHHNPLPIWDLGLEALGQVPGKRKFSFIMDAGSTLNFLADLGTSVILHGHTHIESTKLVGGYGSEGRLRGSTLVLGCGSLGIKCDEIEQLIPGHHFQVIELDVGTIEHAQLRCQDFRAMFRRPNERRKWSSVLSEDKLIFTRALTDFKKKEYQIGASWDPKEVQSVLRSKLIESNKRAFAWEVMDSWSVLRDWNLKPSDRPMILDDLYRRVRAIYKTASQNQIVAALARLFENPPAEHIICTKALDTYLAECLKDPSSSPMPR